MAATRQEFKEAIEILIAGCVLSNSFDAALKDGKFTLIDLRHFLDDPDDLQAAIEDGNVGLKAFFKLSPDQITAAKEKVKEVLDLSNDEVEENIEDIIDGAVKIIGGILQLRKAKG